MGERRGLKYLWRTAPRAPAALFDAADRLGLHPALLQVLYARGLDSPEVCADFLAGLSRDPDDPRLLADLPRAVDRLLQARARGETVAVFTDYDADGVNAAAVLASGLRLVGIEPHVRIPNRFVDGYGLSVAAVDELADRGARVIVTADCGSTAHDAALRARERGVDLIVTDHHQCPPDLPAAFALVNPWRPDCAYPCDHLCGAGVAFKLLQALGDALLPDGRAAMDSLLDLVAVATVADIMPLVGENRRLVVAGLRIMNSHPRPGVRALIRTAGLAPGEVDAAALGFRVAPRVNAAGRLDDPTIAYRLLMATDDDEAFALAAEVDRLNQERQALTREYEAVAMAQARPQVDAGEHGLVAGGEGWPPGIVGLVAGRLVQAHHRPALVYRFADGAASGSGRGIPGFDLLAALHAADDAAAAEGRPLFHRFGGHRAAAGFGLDAARLPELAERFHAAARAALPAAHLEPVLTLDAYLKPETVGFDFARALERLAPFGQGFALPTFGVRDLRLVDSRAVGADGQHWKARLRAEGGYPWEAIAFDGAPLAARVPVGSRLDAAFRLRRTRFEGYWRVELELLDVAPGQPTLDTRTRG